MIILRAQDGGRCVGNRKPRATSDRTTCKIPCERYLKVYDVIYQRRGKNMKIWEIIVKLSVLGGAITVIYYFRDALRGIPRYIRRNPHIKKAIWKLTAKKINLEFRSYRKYYKKIEVKDSDMRNILRIIIRILNESFGGIEQEKKIGKNYIIVRPKTLNVPISIELLPTVGLDYEISHRDLESLPEPLKERYMQEYSEEIYNDEGKEIHLGTTVSIKLFGALTLLYKEREEYETLLNSVEKIYNEIEKYFRLEKPFEMRYVLKAVVVTKSMKDSITIFEKHEYTNWKIEIKGTKVIVHSKTIEPLKKIFDEYLPRVPAF